MGSTRKHAATCASCAEASLLKSLSTAAAELRDYSTARHSGREFIKRLPKSRCNSTARALELALSFPNLSISWQTQPPPSRSRADDFAGWLLKPKPPMQQGSLLRSKALNGSGKRESAYVHAIDSSPPTPLQLGKPGHA